MSGFRFCFPPIYTYCLSYGFAHLNAFLQSKFCPVFEIPFPIHSCFGHSNSTPSNRYMFFHPCSTLISMCFSLMFELSKLPPVSKAAAETQMLLQLESWWKSSIYRLSSTLWRNHWWLTVVPMRIWPSGFAIKRLTQPVLLIHSNW